VEGYAMALYKRTRARESEREGEAPKQLNWR